MGKEKSKIVRDHDIGIELARVLKLKRNTLGRFDLEGGDKTETGLTRTIRRILEAT